MYSHNIHTHMHTHQHTHTYTHTHIHTHTHQHTYIYIHIHTQTCTHTHIHINIYLYTHIHTQTYIHTHTYTHTYIHTHVHTHVHTHTYICIRTYILTKSVLWTRWINPSSIFNANIFYKEKKEKRSKNKSQQAIVILSDNVHAHPTQRSMNRISDFQWVPCYKDSYLIASFLPNVWILSTSFSSFSYAFCTIDFCCLSCFAYPSSTTNL